jgi:hypothetical protein
MLFICNAQRSKNDTIQIYYFHGVDATGNINRRITIFYSDSGILCQRIMFNTGSTVRMYSDDESFSKRSLLQYYQYQEEINNYQIIEDRKEINVFQLDSLLRLLREIKN